MIQGNSMPAPCEQEEIQKYMHKINFEGPATETLPSPWIWPVTKLVQRMYFS